MAERVALTALIALTVAVWLLPIPQIEKQHFIMLKAPSDEFINVPIMNATQRNIGIEEPSGSRCTIQIWTNTWYNLANLPMCMADDKRGRAEWLR